MDEAAFIQLIWQQGETLYRDMPWRRDTRPYYVLVSELMLQQTQVDRVVPKFVAFIERFPDEASLAAAPLADVLVLWQGLGYNRRAKYLHEAVKIVVQEWGGVWPSTPEELQKLPGVGRNTASALAAYAFNYPAEFIETNIRTVYIHHFFADTLTPVHDTQIEQLLAATLDRQQPRLWYWALMDYGAWLKRQGVRTNPRSHHYKKQSALRGSLREMRGVIVRRLSHGPLGVAELDHDYGTDERLGPALEGLRKDGLIEVRDQQLYLTGHS